MTNERISNEEYLQEVWDSLEPAWDKSKFDMKQGYDSEYECDCITITSKDNEGVRAKIYVNDYEGRHPVGFDVVYRYPGDKGVGVMGSYEFQSTDMDGLGEEVFDYFDEIKQKADVASFESDLQSYADAVKADKYDKQSVVDDGWDFYNSVEYDDNIVRDNFKKKYAGKTYLLHITFNPSTKDVSDVKWDISAIESKQTEEAGSFKVGESKQNEGKNEVSNFSRDSLGVSFDGKFGNMRKGESWVVYPETLDKGYICIQGDTRFGYINVNKGFLVLSAPHSTPIYAALMVDINKGKAQRIPLEKEIVDQILNAVNDRTITDHSLDNVIRNADVTDDELKGEAKQTEATKKYYGYGKDDVIDKEDTDFMWQVAYDWFEDRLPERLKGKADSAVYKVIDKDSRAYEEILTMDDYHDYLQKYGPGIIKDIKANNEAKQCEDVQYYYDRLNPTEKEKFNGLSEQIETLVGMYDENGELSKPQQDQLKELRDTIYVFGYVARGYVSFADEVLANYGVEPLIDSKEPVFDEARQPAEYSVHSYNDTDIQHYEDGTPEEWRCQRCGGLNGGEDGEPFGKYITDSNGKVVIRLLCSGCADDACDILNATHGNVRKAIGLGESKKSEDASDPMVIYKEGGIYRTTPKSNYDARIQNAFRIQKWDGFDTPQEIINYCTKYSSGFDPENVIIVESKKSESLTLKQKELKDMARYGQAEDAANEIADELRDSSESKKSESGLHDAYYAKALQAVDRAIEITHDQFDITGDVAKFDADLKKYLISYVDSLNDTHLANIGLLGDLRDRIKDFARGDREEWWKTRKQGEAKKSESEKNDGAYLDGSMSNAEFMSKLVDNAPNSLVFNKDNNSSKNTYTISANPDFGKSSRHALIGLNADDDKYEVYTYLYNNDAMTNPRVGKSFVFKVGSDWNTFITAVKELFGFVGDYIKRGSQKESKKSESLTLKQKELKDMVRYGEAEDITTISDAEAKELKKKGIETVGISRGVYGMNGALLRDNEGNKYVITARSSNLFYFV